MRRYTHLDKLLIQAEGLINVLFADQPQTRANPADHIEENDMTDAEKRQSQGFMRVNHTGEVCAQALYQGQLVLARDNITAAMLEQAAIEETDHLAWTHQRLQELETHRSYLNLFWYVNSFLIGMVAAKCGDAISLGFVEETEKQVSAHLTDHLDKLPQQDQRSRAIVEQMRIDEEHHGAQANQAGAKALPGWVKRMMKFQSKVMTTTAYYI